MSCWTSKKVKIIGAATLLLSLTTFYLICLVYRVFDTSGRGWDVRVLGNCRENINVDIAHTDSDTQS